MDHMQMTLTQKVESTEAATTSTSASVLTYYKQGKVENAHIYIFASTVSIRREYP